jgi:hypothetical protein
MRMHFPRPRSIAALIMSLGIGGAASLALVTDATAHNNRVSGVATCQSDGTYTVTYTVANDFNLSENVVHIGHVGGGTISGLPAAIAASPQTPFKTATVVQTGVAGSATVASLTVKGTWSDGITRTDTGQVRLKGDCTTTVTPPPPTTTQPAAPSFVDASCSAATGSYTIPTTTGVNYFVVVNGGAKTAAPAGTVTEAVGTVVVVSAEAQSGFVLTGTTSWTHTIAGASNCGTPPPPPANTSVVPVSPSITQGVCTAGTESAAFFMIPAVTGVGYFEGASAVAAGNHPVAFGSSTTVTAAALPGYTIPAGATTSWTLTAAAAVTCSPVVTPTVLGVTFTNPPPAAKPPVKTPPVAVLPFTGMPLLPTALFGFGLVLAGALLIGSSKRHRAARVVEGHLTPLR